MHKEYIKLILRRLSRNRIYTIINVLGLGIALTAAFLIYNHVAKELSMDRFHTNGKNIYRVTEKFVRAERTLSLSVGPLAPAAQQEIPGIKDYARLSANSDYGIKTVNQTDFSNNNQTVFADPSLFKIFSFPLVSGTLPDSTDRQGVILSETTARKYFGQENPVGQPILLKDPKDNKDSGKQLYVRGVMKDIRATSSIQADVVVNLPAWDNEMFQHWGGYAVYTFFLVDGQADIRAIEKAIPELSERHYKWVKASDKTVHLQPLEELYFQSGHIEPDTLLRGSLHLTRILCGITLLILILAACNYFMIKIAQLNHNFSDFAIQRCYGSGNRYILHQLFTEITIQMLVAMGIMTGLSLFLHPYFVGIISPRQPYSLTPSLITTGIFLALTVSFISIIGLLLYSYLVRRLDRSGIKNAIQTVSGRFDIKKILTVTQIAIFCALLFCSAILARQMDYIKTKPLGFNNDNIISIYWQDYKADLQTVKDELKRNPDILAVTNGSMLPTTSNSGLDVYSPEYPQNSIKTTYIIGDEDYADTYQLRFTAGRSIAAGSYSKDIMQRSLRDNGHLAEIIVNQRLVKQLKLQEPIGTILWSNGDPRFKIVGVTEDFNFQPLYQSVQPMVLTCDMPVASYEILIRYRPDKREEILTYLKGIYQVNFPNSFFNPLEYRYSDWYDKDIALAKLINIFTGIAILISGMGIFAFSMLMAENRRKEVALRKINGARETEIIRLFNREFAFRVMLACLIGLPAAWYAMDKWLEGFAYKTSLEWWMIAATILVNLLLVGTITSWQTWKAATCNPVDSIKSE